MIQKLELLSPAGNAEFGREAIIHGADAVYIGAPAFGAREAAGNSIEDIEQLVRFAHFYNARVYVALNTLLYDHELKAASAMVYQLWKAGIDALIIQDMALTGLDLPPIPLFASTQTHNMEVEKIAFLEQAGFSRIILARELSLQEISNIRSKTNIELEAFVHGALCVGHSGQCYMSQHLTGRSGNRGRCAQPCRSLYDLTDEQGNVLIRNQHLLSLKDLNLTEHLHSLIQAGVTSFKIEGRLKDLAYVKNITAHYRKCLDNILENEQAYQKASSGQTTLHFEPDPDKTFNRQYTHYFLLGYNKLCGSPLTQKSLGKQVGTIYPGAQNKWKINSPHTIKPGDGLCFFGPNGELEGFLVNGAENNHITPARPIHIPSGTIVYRNLDSEFTKRLNKPSAERKIGIYIKLDPHPQGTSITLTDEDHISVTHIHNFSIEKAKDPIRARQQLATQLSRLGNTPFYLLGPVEVSPLIESFFPASEANSMRRTAIEMLEQQRNAQYKPPVRDQAHPCTYPEQQVDYRGNITNQKASDFYRQHGVRQIDPGWELCSPCGEVPLMTCSYCIRGAFGQCLIRDKNAEWPEPLYLKDQNHRYRLRFDCSRCEMHVLKPN